MCASRRIARRVCCVVLVLLISVSVIACAEADHENESHTLNIYFTQSSNEGHAAFMQLYPDVIIEHEPHLTNDEIYTMVLTQSSKVDMFGSNTAIRPSYPDLVKRGFYAPIESEKLRAYAENCYPGIRDVIFVNGELAGIPVKCLPFRQIGVDKDMWYELGLDDDMLPQTWLELIDFIKNQWPNYADDYPDRCAISGEGYWELYGAFISSYKIYRQRSMVDPGYDTELFRDTMNAYLSVDPEEFESDNAEKLALFTTFKEVTPKVPSILADMHYTVIPIGMESADAKVARELWMRSSLVSSCSFSIISQKLTGNDLIRPLTRAG